VQKVGDGFESGRPMTQEDLSNELGIEPELTRLLIDRLTTIGVLARLDPPERITLARPTTAIDLDQVLEIGFELADGPTGTSDPILNRLRNAQKSAIQGLHLADTPPPAAEDGAPRPA